MPFVPFKKKLAQIGTQISESVPKKKKKKVNTAPSNKILTKNNLKPDSDSDGM